MASDAIELLTEDHDQVKAMFEEYEDIDDDDQKLSMARQICSMLDIHTNIEEELFYPAARDALADDALIDEAIVEHAGAKDLIEQIEVMDPSDDLFDAKVLVLKEYIEHHVQEEEQELFPKLKDTDMELDDLGAQMAERKEELMMIIEAAARQDAERQQPGARR